MTTPDSKVIHPEIFRPVLREDSDPLECVKEATEKMQELHKESCELPLEKLAELAQDHGVKPHEILALADESESCFIDYTTGHVRCKEEEAAG